MPSSSCPAELPALHFEAASRWTGLSGKQPWRACHGRDKAPARNRSSIRISGKRSKMSASEATRNLSNSFFSASLADSDPEIARAITLELGRQRDEIELIASENIVSKAVLEAQGSVMTNKYAEGYPRRRYYGGCQFVDIAEEFAIERACRLFECKYANVQPNSGSQANQAVFMALMKPGDTFMGLDLACGGHL